MSLATYIVHLAGTSTMNPGVIPPEMTPKTVENVLQRLAKEQDVPYSEWRVLKINVVFLVGVFELAFLRRAVLNHGMSSGHRLEIRPLSFEPTYSGVQSRENILIDTLYRYACYEFQTVIHRSASRWISTDESDFERAMAFVDDQEFQIGRAHV